MKERLGEHIEASDKERDDADRRRRETHGRVEQLRKDVDDGLEKVHRRIDGAACLLVKVGVARTVSANSE